MKNFTVNSAKFGKNRLSTYEVSETVRDRSKKEKDVSILQSMHNAALESNSIKQFEDKIANL